MEKYLVIFFFVFLSSWHIDATSSCISVLNGEKCAQIQAAGQVIAKRIKQSDNIIQNALFRSIHESQLIVDASMKYLKTESLKVKVAHPGVTPIESSQLKAAEKLIVGVTVRSVKNGNHKFWQVFRKACKLLLKDERVASILLHYSAGKTAKRSAPTLNSLSGILKSLEPELKTLLTSVELELKGASKNAFSFFADSLKILLNGKVQIDFDQTKANLEQFLLGSVNVTLESAFHQSSIILKEAVQQVEIIDSLVETLKQDSRRLSEALHPARILISEALNDIQYDGNSANLQNKFVSTLKSLKDTYIEIKSTVTS
ncbi:uncharacterized protein LOC130613157 [Hydractinia symbiolongicarpus]|uniref:uncharacterized protein LOC130613157 n=1 Tax=Hydractinia symbiolongicarpus TaxID=13093 RepID=UPI00254E27BD|nr:uncharacterized protein LOC130613157 [Hydractinia symbiolongicarpus]